MTRPPSIWCRTIWCRLYLAEPRSFPWLFDRLIGIPSIRLLVTLSSALFFSEILSYLSSQLLYLMKSLDNEVITHYTIHEMQCEATFEVVPILIIYNHPRNFKLTSLVSYIASESSGCALVSFANFIPTFTRAFFFYTAELLCSTFVRDVDKA